MIDEDITALALKYHCIKEYGCKMFMDGDKIVIIIDKNNNIISKIEYQKILFLEIEKERPRQEY